MNNSLRIAIVKLVTAPIILLILLHSIKSSTSFYHHHHHHHHQRGPTSTITRSQSYNTSSKNHHHHNPSSYHHITFAIRGGSDNNNHSSSSSSSRISASELSPPQKSSSSSSSSSSKSKSTEPKIHLGMMNSKIVTPPKKNSKNDKEGSGGNVNDDENNNNNNKEFVLNDDRVLYSLPSPGDNNRDEDWKENNNRDDMNKYIKALKDDGVVVIPNVYTKNQINKMIKQQKQIHKKVKKMMANSDAPVNKPYRHDFDKKRYFLMKHYDIEDEDDDDEEYEVIEISPGRYDYDYGMNDDERYPIFNSNEYQYPSILSELMDTLLVADYKSYSGCLPSNGKSNDGPWHRDTYILFDDESIDIKLPPYYYTVLIPLVPISVENGATEFIPGSHKMTCKDAIAIESDNNRFQACVNDESDCGLGSIIVFDGRICHRGLRNLTNQNRTVLYMVWTKNWYNDY